MDNGPHSPGTQPMASEAEITEAALALRAGKLVAFPTETVYGLGANALHAEAVEQIFRTKGRPKTSPLIVHVASVEQARGLVAEWPPAAELLAERFWPGPLTLVLPKRALVPEVVTAGLPSVGIRIPAHPVARRLLQLAGVPVAAPSANRFMELSPTLPEHVRRSLGSNAALVLEGGASEVGLESTVLSLMAEPPLLLRLGGVSAELLRSVLGPIRLASGAAAADVPHASPGMHSRHYSPRTPLVLWKPGDAVPTGRAVWLWRRATPPADAPSIGMPQEAAAYAQALYRALHEADAMAADLILVEAPPVEDAWAAIADRLQRAAVR